MEADGASPAMETKHAATPDGGATGIQTDKSAVYGLQEVEVQAMP